MRSALTAFILGLLGACGDDAGDDTSATGDSDPPPAKTYDPTWAGVQELFADECSRCHPSQQGLDLFTAIPADITGGTFIYLTPGSADDSLLWTVLGTPTLSFMPQDGQLPMESVDHVRVWINDGASLD